MRYWIRLSLIVGASALAAAARAQTPRLSVVLSAQGPRGIEVREPALPRPEIGDEIVSGWEQVAGAAWIGTGEPSAPAPRRETDRARIGERLGFLSGVSSPPAAPRAARKAPPASRVLALSSAGW